MQKLTIRTSKKREVVDITKIINDLLMKNTYDEGIVFLFSTHTTCALTCADLDPGGTDEDYLNAYESMVPKLQYRHPHDSNHFGEHLVSSTIGSSLFVPVTSASLVLGAWQRVVLIEFSGPRERHITLSFVKENSMKKI